MRGIDPATAPHWSDEKPPVGSASA
jgi:hypothetical protein